MKILVLVFTRMTSAFLAESCQGDRTQEQQTVLKIAKSTVEVHSLWHDIYVATETGGQMWAFVYYSVLLRKSEGPTPRCTNTTIIIFPQIRKPRCANPRTRRVCCIKEGTGMYKDDR
jgi:hypothetical protein